MSYDQFSYSWFKCIRVLAHYESFKWHFEWRLVRIVHSSDYCIEITWLYSRDCS